ncbi:MAG: enoyl-CoA hydratase/isomerase family protein, partial [Acidimicrobiales bacterium]|nr:enoyl-CoA hydratase/isomerase family protein [Acidimicrobiales bacterium]
MTWEGIVDRSKLPGADSISARVDGHVGVIELNEPERLNPTGLNHMHIHFQLNEWRADHDIRVVVLTGKGRAFCAGADIRPTHSGGHDGEGWTNGQRLAFHYAYGNFWQTLRDFPKPTIAAVNGYAIGGGWEMVEVCDLVIASDQAVFWAGEIDLGLLPFGTGLPYLTKILGKHRAMLLGMTGRKVSAQQALEWGLVNEVVEH